MDTNKRWEMRTTTCPPCPTTWSPCPAKARTSSSWTDQLAQVGQERHLLIVGLGQLAHIGGGRLLGLFQPDSFAKATLGGYNLAQVDEFLDALTEDYARSLSRSRSRGSSLIPLFTGVKSSS